MIYTKNAKFPYPFLMNDNIDYLDSEFMFDMDLKENTSGYELSVKYSIASDFIKTLIDNKKVDLILIIKSVDNQFYSLSKKNGRKIYIKKNRLSLSKRTTMQLMILTLEDIDFANNNDLIDFYNNYKKDIVVKKGKALGFSNTVIFDGSQNKPYDIFEKKLDPNISSDIKIEVTNDLVIIKYKNEDVFFADQSYNKNLINPYIYIGLQRALFAFIENNKIEDDNIRLDEVGDDISGLDYKLKTLMLEKGVEELNADNVDEVIYNISDNLIKKFTSTVKEISYGN